MHELMHRSTKCILLKKPTSYQNKTANL